MLEILILLVLLGGFVYVTYFMEENKEEDPKESQINFDLIFTVSIVLLASSFVLGILFSEKVIKFLMSVSQLASIGLLLNKIKGFFGGNQVLAQPALTDNKVENMSGGAQIDMGRHNDMYDDLPESDSEDEF